MWVPGAVCGCQGPFCILSVSSLVRYVVPGNLLKTSVAAPSSLACRTVNVSLPRRHRKPRRVSIASCTAGWCQPLSLLRTTSPALEPGLKKRGTASSVLVAAAGTTAKQAPLRPDRPVSLKCAQVPCCTRSAGDDPDTPAAQASATASARAAASFSLGSRAQVGSRVSRGRRTGRAHWHSLRNARKHRLNARQAILGLGRRLVVERADAQRKVTRLVRRHALQGRHTCESRHTHAAQGARQQPMAVSAPGCSRSQPCSRRRI